MGLIIYSEVMLFHMATHKIFQREPNGASWPWRKRAAGSPAHFALAFPREHCPEP